MGGGASKSKKVVTTKQEPKATQQPVKQVVSPVHNNAVSESKKEVYMENKPENNIEQVKATENISDDTKLKQAKEIDPDALPWRQILDKVSMMELWEEKSREGRDEWREYLTRADELIRKPRKTIPMDVVHAILEGDMTAVDLSKVPNAQPKIVVFVSSTFTDTKAERNQLMKDVYPFVRSVCRRLGIDFGTVDMRWGVTEDATNDHSTTEMCVKEIHRCMKDSASTAFLCLLSHKYGYRPLPAKIVHSEFEEMLTHLEKSGKDTSMMKSYYKRDDNAVPAEYVLRPKTKEDTNWWDDVEAIQDNMRLASVACYGEADKRCDKYHISVTETEIHHGIFDNDDAIEQASVIRRNLDDYKSDFHKDRKILDMKGKEVDDYAQGKLTTLRNTKLPTALSKDKIFDVSYDGANVEECVEYIQKVCDHVCKTMVESILDSYEKRLHVLEDPEFQEAMQHRALANEKASLFVGRHQEISKIQDYLKSPDRHVLVVHGPSGCGKTALMSVVTKSIKSLSNDGVVVLRFLGTTGQSGSARNVMVSLCTQIARVYNKEVVQPSTYKDLIKHFRTCMGFATGSRPLFLVLDSLDQLSNEDLGQNLAWLSLSEELPEHVKLVVSSLPTKCLDILKSHVPEDNFVEVQLLKPNEGPEIISKMLDLQHRKITETQENVINEAFKKCPLPLFLRLAVDIALQWHSYDEVTSRDLAEDMPGLITMLFDRLESRYGEMFVHHALSYITASRHGLSLAELEDILSCDDEVLDSVFKWWVPPVRRIPPLLWARVRNELGIYLAEKGTNGISAYGWYHRQFWETAEKRYLENTFGTEKGPFREKAHEAIADYFEGRWENGKPHVNTKSGALQTQKLEDRKLPKQPTILSGSRTTGRQLNRRKLAELPFHLIQLKQWERFQKLAIDLKYIEAQFEAGNGFNCLSELIQATKLSDIDSIKQMTRFVGANLGFMLREPQGIYQMALQQSMRSEIRQLLSKIDQPSLPVPLMSKLHEEDFYDPCEMTLHGHTETVRTCDYSPKGDLLVSAGDDCSMRIWDTTTGAELVCISSLPAPVWPGKDEAVTLMIHPVNPCCFNRTGEIIGSGTEQGDVMLWNTSGGQIKAVPTENLAVTYVRFSRSNKILGTTFKNGRVSFWSATDLTLLGDTELTGFETTCLDFSFDDSTCAVMCLLGLILVDMQTFCIKSKHQGTSYQNLCCEYHPDGQEIMTGGDDSQVSVWDANTGKHKYSLRRHKAWIWSLKITKDGNHMFTGSSDRTMKVWKRTNGNWDVVATVGGHSHRVSMVSLEATTESKLVTSSLDRSLKVWDTQALIKGDIPPAGQGHFTSCLTSAKGKYIAKSQGWFHCCTVLDGATGNELGTTTDHVGFVKEAYFTVEEDRLFVLDHGHSGTYDTGAEAKAKITVTAVPSMSLVCGNIEVASPMSFSLNKKYIFVGTGKGSMHLFDLHSYQEVNSWNCGVDKPIYKVAAVRDNVMMAACHEQVCQVWEASDSHKKHVKNVTGRDSNINTIAFSPDGRFLVIAVNTGWIYVHNSSKSDIPLINILKQQSSFMYNMVFSSAGDMMVSCSANSMQIWDIKEEITPRCTYYAPVNYADFLSNNIVVVGEATGKQVMLSF